MHSDIRKPQEMLVLEFVFRKTLLEARINDKLIIIYKEKDTVSSNLVEILLHVALITVDRDVNILIIIHKVA